MNETPKPVSEADLLLKQALDAMEWFVWRCEHGEARSHRTYLEYRRILCNAGRLESESFLAAPAALPLRYDVNRGAGHLAREYAAQDRVGARILTEPMGTWPGGECIVTAMHPDAESDIVLQVRRVQDGDECGVFGYETVYEIAPKVFHPSGE